MPSERPAAAGDPRRGVPPGADPDGDHTRQMPAFDASAWAREQPAPPDADLWVDPDGRPADEDTLLDTPSYRDDGPYNDAAYDDLSPYVDGAGVPYDQAPDVDGPYADGPYDDEAALDVVDAPYDDPAPYDEVVAPVFVAQGTSRRAWPWVLAAIVVVVLLAGAGIGAWVLTHRPAPLEAVPSLDGRTEASAAKLLTQRHLVLSVAGRAYDPKAPRGTITGQTPRGGALRAHRPVAVTISLGPQPVRLPGGLDGKSRSEVTELVQAVGLRVGRVTNATSLTVPSGDVVSTAPADGTLLPGQDVSLVVSTGKPEVVVPLLTGSAVQSYANAAAALSAAHLAPSEVVVYSDSVARGLVIITDPAPRATVAYGSAVQVDVSDGPHYVTVPQVTNDTVAGADSVLGADGFTVSGVTGNPARRVLRTSPAAGRTVLFGSSVQLVTRRK